MALIKPRINGVPESVDMLVTKLCRLFCKA